MMVCFFIVTNYCQLIIVTSPIFGLSHDHWDSNLLSQVLAVAATTVAEAQETGFSRDLSDFSRKNLRPSVHVPSRSADPSH